MNLITDEACHTVKNCDDDSCILKKLLENILKT